MAAAAYCCTYRGWKWCRRSSAHGFDVNDHLARLGDGVRHIANFQDFGPPKRVTTTAFMIHSRCECKHLGIAVSDLEHIELLHHRGTETLSGTEIKTLCLCVSVVN